MLVTSTIFVLHISAPSGVGRDQRSSRNAIEDAICNQSLEVLNCISSNMSKSHSVRRRLSYCTY